MKNTVFGITYLNVYFGIFKSFDLVTKYLKILILKESTMTSDLPIVLIGHEPKIFKKN